MRVGIGCRIVARWTHRAAHVFLLIAVCSGQSSWPALFQSAEQAFETGHYARAIETWKQALAALPPSYSVKPTASATSQLQNLGLRYCVLRSAQGLGCPRCWRRASNTCDLAPHPGRN